MLFASIITSILFFHGITVIFEKKKISLLLKTILINYVLSLKFYTMFVGTPRLERVFELLTSPTLEMIIVPFLVGLQVFFCLYLYYSLEEKRVIQPRYSDLAITEPDNRSQFKEFRRIFANTLALLLIFIGFLFLLSCYWALSYFGEIDINQILYTLKEPLSGTGNEQIESFLFNPLVNSALLGFFTWGLITFFLHYKIVLKTHIQKNSLRIWRYLSLPVALVILAANLFFGLSAFGLDEIKTALFSETEFYEEYYVQPNQVNITFPEQKRNLIYIYVESLETTYFSTSLGGAQKDNLLPGLSELASENINFSNTNKLGGALTLPGTNFTAAGMVSQTSGTPVKTSVVQEDGGSVEGNAGNQYGENTESFMPGVVSLGEMLEDQGYRQQLLIGSKAIFGGREKYFTEHGNYEILDYDHAVENDWIPEDYYVWWGYEDEKLYEFAKEQLVELGSSEQPFNFTMLTADTHFPDGYKNENTPEVFDDQYSNVIHWTDEMLTDFIHFIQEQPFYENTTIIISGDHLSMDQDFFENLSSDYKRTVFDVIINSPVSTENTKNRQFSTLDLFPTTLAALGVNIEGNRLGLGTNLFSDRSTLIEELGYETVYTELQKKSLFYNYVLMKNTNEGLLETSSTSSSSSNSSQATTSSSSSIPEAQPPAISSETPELDPAAVTEPELQDGESYQDNVEYGYNDYYE